MAATIVPPTILVMMVMPTVMVVMVVMMVVTGKHRRDAECAERDCQA